MHERLIGVLEFVYSRLKLWNARYWITEFILCQYFLHVCLSAERWIRPQFFLIDFLGKVGKSRSSPTLNPQSLKSCLLNLRKLRPEISSRRILKSSSSSCKSSSPRKNSMFFCVQLSDYFSQSRSLIFFGSIVRRRSCSWNGRHFELYMIF